MGEGEVPVVTDGGKFDRSSPLTCGGSARDLAVLAAAWAEKRKGEGRDFPGLFIGAVNLKNKLGFRACGMIRRTGSVPCWSWAPGQRSGMTRGPGRSAEEGLWRVGSKRQREGVRRRTPSGFARLGLGPKARLGHFGPPGAFSYFRFSFHFSFFCFPYFFHIICKFDSNQVKQSSKFL
jgi:hypothetical protein